MTKRKLTPDEDRVLLFLYEHTDDGREVPFTEIVAGTCLAEHVVRVALRTLREAGYIGGSGQDLLVAAMAALKETDPGFTPTKRGYAEHIILIASAISKADEGFLAQELAYEPEFVGLVGSRLRNANIWIGDALNPRRMKQWTGEGGDISFFLDGAVATGDLMVVEEKDGEPQFQMTPGGKTHVESLLRR